MEAGSAVYAIVTRDERPGTLSHLEAGLIREGFKVVPSVRDIQGENRGFSNIFTSKDYKIGFIIQREGKSHYSLVVRGEICCCDDAAKERLNRFAQNYEPVAQEVSV